MTKFFIPHTLAACRTRLTISLKPQAYRKLVPNGPGLTQARDILESMRPADLVAGAVKDADEGSAMLAGLWLWHDYLDESHRIAQQIETPTGSFWHALLLWPLFRREIA